MTAQAHQVLKEFKYDFYYHLKHLIVLYDTYKDLKWQTLTNENFAFRRESIIKQSDIIYGFCKACKNCNVRRREQIEELKKSEKSILDERRANLTEYLNPAPKEIKRYTKKQIERFEKKLNFKYKNKLEWIKENGVVINCITKNSIPDYVKATDINEYFNEYMTPDLFGYVDYYNSVILVDNINLNAVHRLHTKNFTTDNWGRIKINTSDNTGFYFLQFDKPNTLFKYWSVLSDKYGILRRLYYHEPGIQKDKFKNIGCYSSTNNFTITPALEIKNISRRNKILSVKKIMTEQTIGGYTKPKLHLKIWYDRVNSDGLYVFRYELNGYCGNIEFKNVVYDEDLNADLYNTNNFKRVFRRFCDGITNTEIRFEKIEDIKFLIANILN